MISWIPVRTVDYRKVRRSGKGDVSFNYNRMFSKCKRIGLQTFLRQQETSVKLRARAEVCSCAYCSQTQGTPPSILTSVCPLPLICKIKMDHHICFTELANLIVYAKTTSDMQQMLQKHSCHHYYTRDRLSSIPEAEKLFSFYYF